MLLRVEKPFVQDDEDECEEGEEEVPCQFAIRVENNELFATVTLSQKKVNPGDSLACDVEFRGKCLQLAALLVQNDHHTLDSALVFTKNCLKTQVFLHLPQHTENTKTLALNLEFVCGPHQSHVRTCSVPLSTQIS